MKRERMQSSTRFQNLRLQNFRCFEDAEFKFGDQFNVIIGENGKGKSSILDALSLAIAGYARFFSSLHDCEIQNEDIRLFLRHFDGAPSTIERSYPSKISGMLSLDEKNIPFLLARGEKPEEANARGADRLVQEGVYVKKLLESSSDVILPVFAYYHITRAARIAQKNERTRRAIDSRTSGYDNCLDQNASITRFSDWLETITYISLQEGMPSELLTSVLNSIYQCFPEIEKIEFRVRDNSLVFLFKNDMLFRFNELSDGYRSALTLAADIAYRAACLNPHLKKNAMSHVGGIVLIDEIDIHLHPSWQRRIVGDLKRAFPAMQFITTTHSPFIIQSLEPGEIINLNHPEQDRQEYEKLSIEDIVEEIMGVPVPQRSKKYQDMYDIAQKYYALLENSKPEGSSELKLLEEKLHELSAPFSDDVAYTAFLDFKRAEAKALWKRENKNAAY